MGLALLALPVSSALASSSSSSVPTGIEIGPMTVDHGYTLTITGSCNEPNAYVYVSLVKAGHDYTITHSYYYNSVKRAHSTCTTANNLGSGSMNVSWGGLLSGKLKFSKAGRLKGYSVQSCKGTFGHERKVTGKGTLKMAIHTGVFGKLDLQTVKGDIQEFNGTCSGGAEETGLFASWDKSSAGINAYVTPRGKRFVDVSAPDNASHSVRGSAEDVFEGKNLFTVRSNLSSAKVTGFDPFLTGSSLKYKASSGCTNGSTTGKLSGKLVLHDPVSGTFRFIGKKATAPFVSLERTNGKC